MKDRVIDVRKILKDLKNSILIIIIAAVIFGLLFSLMSGFFVKDTCKSSAEFAIVDNQNSKNDVMVIDKNAVMITLQETCMSLLESDSFIGEALADAGYSDISAEEFIQNNIKTTKMQGVVVGIDVSTDDSEKSLAIAESICRKLEEYVPEMSEDYKVSIVSPPVQAEEKNTRKLAGILGVIIGLLLSCAFIVLRGLVTLKIRDKSDIGLVTDIPVVAEIKRGGISDADNLYKEKEYRALKNELLWIMKKNNINTALFMSADDSTCCEEVCIRTAAAIAETEKRVMIIDSGTQDNSITARYDKAGCAGLSDVLANGAKAEDCITGIKIASNTIDLMPIGKQGAADIPACMDADKLSRLIDELRNRYDCILINTDSINNSPEAVMMSRLFNTVIVVDSSKTKLDSLQEAVNKVKNSADKISGIVLCR